MSRIFPHLVETGCLLWSTPRPTRSPYRTSQESSQPTFTFFCNTHISIILPYTHMFTKRILPCRFSDQIFVRISCHFHSDKCQRLTHILSFSNAHNDYAISNYSYPLVSGSRQVLPSGLWCLVSNFIISVLVV